MFFRLSHSPSNSPSHSFTRSFAAALAAVLLAFFALTGAALAAVEVNNADPSQLETIKGIGPALSGKIMAERKQSAFKDWSDFESRVSGVGEKNAASFSRAGSPSPASRRTARKPAPTLRTPRRRPLASPATLPTRHSRRSSAWSGARPRCTGRGSPRPSGLRARGRRSGRRMSGGTSDGRHRRSADGALPDRTDARARSFQRTAPTLPAAPRTAPTLPFSPPAGGTEARRKSFLRRCSGVAPTRWSGRSLRAAIAANNRSFDSSPRGTGTASPADSG